VLQFENAISVVGGQPLSGATAAEPGSPTKTRDIKQRFEITKKLGSGTYGKVSLAYDHKTEREASLEAIPCPGLFFCSNCQMREQLTSLLARGHILLQVAVKLIKKSAIENKQDLVRIRREIRIMSALKHPNIIQIYEGSISSGAQVEEVQCSRTRTRSS
jgi:serine/threonine protein kinase